MYYVIEYDGLRKIMDVKHDMQTELQNQRFPSALADLMKTGDMYSSTSATEYRYCSYLHLVILQYGGTRVRAYVRTCVRVRTYWSMKWVPFFMSVYTLN